MPRRIKIEPHLNLAELESRYRRAKDSVEKSHYQIIWLLAQGKTSEEVAAVTGYSRSWIYELVWGYNRVGPQTLGDKRHEHPGAEPLLNESQRMLLWQTLQSPPMDGTQWNGTKVAAWMSQQLGRPVSRQRGWEYLKAMNSRSKFLEIKRNGRQTSGSVETEETETLVDRNADTDERSLRLRRVTQGGTLVGSVVGATFENTAIHSESVAREGL
jgi:transposase